MTSPTLRTFYQAVATDSNRLSSFVIMPDGQMGRIEDIFSPHAIFHILPGSFNPLHEGHKAIYHQLGLGAKLFEISIHRKDKEPLEFEELEKRLKQFAWYAPIVVTNALYFGEKAGLFCRKSAPTFHLGIDTAKRLLADHGVVGVQGYNANFVVYPRKVNDKVVRISDLIAESYGGIIPFNMEAGDLPDNVLGLSSTAIRNGK